MRVVHGALGMLTHAPFQGIVIGIFKPGRVDQAELKITYLGVAFPAVSGDAGCVINDCVTLPGQPVEQRRLADIWAANNGDSKGNDNPTIQ